MCLHLHPWTPGDAFFIETSSRSVVMDGPGILSIQAFLLEHAERADTPALVAGLERHRDRTMTVVHRNRIETITRCGTCPNEQLRPCRGLRVLALPYAHHPAYRPEWSLPHDDEPSEDHTLGQYAGATPD
jgi:hypothetical protein